MALIVVLWTTANEGQITEVDASVTKIESAGILIVYYQYCIPACSAAYLGGSRTATILRTLENYQRCEFETEKPRTVRSFTVFSILK